MVVAALALALVVAVLAGAVMARSVGTVIGAAAAHDRLLARTVAEDVLHSAVIGVDRLAVVSRSVGGDRGASLDELARTLEDQAGSDARVSVDLSEADGDVAIRVGAIVGGSTATVTARLRPRSSPDVAWLIESRARDPLLQGLPRTACTWPNEDGRRHPGCRDMPLPVGAVLGPLHSNDRLPDGTEATSHAPVTSSAVGPDGAAHRSEVPLPRDVATVLADRPPTCRFRGPTLLRLDGPRIRVTSPRSVPRANDPPDVDRAIGCFDVDRALLAGVVVVELPSVATIEVVADVADDCVLHPLGLEAVEDRERTWACDAGDVFVWGRYTGTRTILAHDSIQLLWDVEPGDSAGPRPLDDGDMLGLVATDSIVLRRPLGRDPTSLHDVLVAFAGEDVPPFGTYPLDAPNPMASHWDAPRVVASMAALRGSLAPQNAGLGDAPSGPISIIGSLAARFAPATTWDVLDRRGRPSGTREFPLVLDYDDRLIHSPPPAMPLIDDGRLRIIELDVG